VAVIQLGSRGSFEGWLEQRLNGLGRSALELESFHLPPRRAPFRGAHGWTYSRERYTLADAPRRLPEARGSLMRVSSGQCISHRGVHRKPQQPVCYEAAGADVKRNTRASVRAKEGVWAIDEG
jgi:hypothetical protein